jgi:hypothetical protein
LAYFAAGCVATVAARNLHVGVRTVTYRPQQIKELWRIKLVATVN